MVFRSLKKLPAPAKKLLEDKVPPERAKLHRVFLAAIYDAPEMAEHCLEDMEAVIGREPAITTLEELQTQTFHWEEVADRIGPPEIAVCCGSLRFLEWWEQRIGRMPLAGMLFISCAEAVVESLVWLIERRFTLKPMNDGDDDLQSILADREKVAGFLGTIVKQNVNASVHERYLSEQCLLIFAPFVKSFDNYPNFEDHGDLGGPLITNPYLSRQTYQILRDVFGHGPDKSNWIRFFDAFFDDEFSGDREFAAHFVRLLKDFFSDDADRVPIVKHYANRILRFFKVPELLSYIIQKDIIPADANLVAALHAIDSEVHPAFNDRLCMDIFDSLALVLPIVAAKNEGCGASSWDLAAAMSNTDESDSIGWTKALEGYRGLVRLLLYFGAKPDHPQVRATVSEYPNLLEDILDVARWKRWEQSGNFCGLPGEITRMIMFRVWRGTFKAV